MRNRELLLMIAEGYSAPASLSPEETEREDFERIRQTLYMAVVAESIPRRLGKDAVGPMLAIDKRIARRVANAYRSLWMSEGPDAPAWSSREERIALARDADDVARRAGATVRWASFLRERRDEVGSRRRLVAALALREGTPRWGARRVRILETEIINIERIAEDIGALARRRTA